VKGLVANDTQQGILERSHFPKSNTVDDKGLYVTMNFASTIALGGIAGFTIYLGLPVARIKNPSRAWQNFLNSLAVGILVFLFYDMLEHAFEPIKESMATAKTGSAGEFLGLIALFVIGFAVGLVALIYFDRVMIKPTAQKVQENGGTARQIAIMIAIGIGLHNFSEGLAIGLSAQKGEVALATLLIIGFALHNATEGFGIAAPLTMGSRPSWRLLALLGLIAGGPTFLGTVVGFHVFSEPIFVLCLALAAGSILYVLIELLNVGRRFSMRELAAWGIFIGFIVAFGTDLILSASGG
jgi:ZIP family zinc transporter